ncbi:MAG: prepilin-type N-terminal cleavage/methylation domain-containing protein [Woeseiaceae bacterium]|nr:prepilin-type N-terminal cleavage/methylation domain-containing protein [Woeseiaceae bacterium]
MRRHLRNGYTLVELLIVVGTVALIAAIAIPATMSTNSDEQLEQVANEFADAIRFARSESIRTGDAHGFRFLTNQYRIRVFSADTAVSPWTWVWDVYHPLDKDLYDYTFPANLAGSDVPVVHVPDYRGTCDRQGVVYFDANGTPWCLEPETVLLESYRLDLVAGNSTASVSLDGITGRVTVQ